MTDAPPEVDLRHHGDTELGPGLVDMAVNVRPGTPPLWLARILCDSITGLAAYPDPSSARDAVARRHDRRAEEVLLTAGGAEAFVLLARALAPRRPVVVHPQFTEPEAALRAAGHDVTRVILRDGFRLDRIIPDDADLVMIGNPTNPTSVLHPAERIAGLARSGRTLVVDEAFMDCVPGETESLAAGGVPGLVVVRSLTKTWGLAGLRAGYLLAEPELVELLAEAQPLWAVSAPALAAIETCVSPRALAEADAWARDLVGERERLAAELGRLGLYVVPGARASFLCVRAEDALGLRDRLRERGFAVRRGDTFPGLGPDWFRVAVRDRATDDAFIAAVREAISPHRPPTQGPGRPMKKGAQPWT
jgi:histidinol-phosphate aminotransferase